MTENKRVLKLKESGLYLIVRDATRFAPISQQREATKFTYERAKKFKEDHLSMDLVLVKLLPKGAKKRKKPS